jgi:hypothetical protein
MSPGLYWMTGSLRNGGLWLMMTIIVADQTLELTLMSVDDKSLRFGANKENPAEELQAADLRSMISVVRFLHNLWLGRA